MRCTTQRSRVFCCQLARSPRQMCITSYYKKSISCLLAADGPCCGLVGLRVATSLLARSSNFHNIVVLKNLQRCIKPQRQQDAKGLIRDVPAGEPNQLRGRSQPTLEISQPKPRGGSSQSAARHSAGTHGCLLIQDQENPAVFEARARRLPASPKYRSPGCACRECPRARRIAAD